MEVGKVVGYDDYLTLLWWSAIGFKKILGGEDARAVAEKHLEGIDRILDEMNVRSGIYLKKTKKKCQKT